ncbi:MAG: hypothetical protein AB7U20_25025 [Planctomycetaceae bacterium]
MPVASALVVACVASGCANLLTTRSIQKFADSLAQQDIETLKRKTSDNFEEKALRSAEALDDFKILNLPDGKVSVVSVEEVSDTEKRVTVQVGERKKELLYKLVRQPGSRQWLVDDIYLEQKKSGMDQPITKSVTETMDLLITVRAFLDSWQTGGREDVLAVTTPEMRAQLADLSPTHLQQLTTQVVGKRSTHSAFRPDARIEDNRAVVILPRSGGKLLVELNIEDGRWLVNDVAVESRESDVQVRSARRMAQILNAAAGFLTAYHVNDQTLLKQHSTDAFYRNSIAVGDLESAPLPTPRLLASRYQVRVHEKLADLILEANDGTYVFALAEPEDSGKKGAYRVQEVTIYESNNDQIKRLSALFTSHAMLEIFTQALTARDLSRLKHSSTTDLNQSVWNLLDEELLAALPLDEIPPMPPRVVATAFQGPMTEITVSQGTRTLTYILRESRGQIAVDDILVPAVHRPTSMKQNLRTLIPIYALARAIYADDMVEIRRASSRELDRLVWQPLGQVPDIGCDIVRHLTAPVTAMTMTEDRAQLTLGDENYGARISLAGGDGRYIVDDVLLITGPLPNQQIELKTVGRLNLARGPAQ